MDSQGIPASNSIYRPLACGLHAGYHVEGRITQDPLLSIWVKPYTSLTSSFDHVPPLKATRPQALQRGLARVLHPLLDCALSSQDPQMLFPNGPGLLPAPCSPHPQGHFPTHVCTPGPRATCWGVDEAWSRRLGCALRMAWR